MKLLFAIKTLGPHGGGAEKVLAQVSGELSRRGHEVTIVTFDSSEVADFYDIDERVGRIWLGTSARDAPTRFSNALKTIARLRALSGKLKPDVAIGFMHSAYVLLALALAGTPVPVIGSEHAPMRHFRTRPFQSWLVRATAPIMRRMTVPTEAVRAQFPRSIARRMAVISNPVAGARPKAATLRKRKRLLTVGRLSPEKGQPILIEAFSRIADAHPDWELRLIGDGELRGELQRSVQDVRLDSRVRFTGTVRDVAAELAEADLYVVPSAYESFGIATAEALASGIPAVGFADCPGISELIQPGVNGVLVNPGKDRVAALAAALDELMDSDARRTQLAQAAPATVDRYTVPAIVDAWEKLLQKSAGPS